MNKVILIGNLTKDPELRTTTSGISVCTFTLAVSRRVADRTSGKREADFINIAAWRQTADLCAQYLAKGRKAGIVGSIQTRSYNTQDGSKRYVTEVIADEVEFLSAPVGDAYEPANRQEEAPPVGAVDDDELPF